MRPKRYKTGTRMQIFKHMVECAVRDREAMIIAYRNVDDDEGAEIRRRCKDEIEDFKRMWQTYNL